MNFADRLIGWYQDNKRDLPWRDSQDPYRIWLSEIILQQTRVQQGLPYYERFVAHYPTVKDLASAPEDEVLRLWQGLGYYSRARNMHHTARYIGQELDGEFPATYADLIKLKGVGAYTAAAIASFAFKEKVAAVDGNVYRVLSRVFGIADDIASGKGKKVFQQLADELIAATDHPDLFNQALMEFGALHCTPRNPNCLFCPFGAECEARAKGTQHQLPVKSKKVKVRKRIFHYLVFEYEGRLLLKQRKQRDIWQGLFDFYLIESDKFYNFEGVFQQLCEAKGEAVEMMDVQESKVYTHQLTHQHLSVIFYHCHLPEGAVFEEVAESLELVETNRQQVTDLPKPILIERYLKEYIY